ncbi:MAG: transglycosylase SLT domain-containing protein [Bryobacteraceae bacterium]|nr:transglycosylase SLT domain-containing protein [Bryobacteraceae bacterium]
MTIPPLSGRTIRVRCPKAAAAAVRLAAAILLAGALLPAQDPPRQASGLAPAANAAARGEPGAAERLAALARAYPQIPDFLAYWRAQALAAGKRYEEAAAALDPVWRTRYPSSLAGRAAVLGADALLRAGRYQEALAMLARVPAEQLPEPQATLAAARAREALGEKAHAAALYQRVWCLYPLAPEAAAAAEALEALSRDPGLALSPPPDELRMERAERLARGGRLADARQEWRALARQAAAAATREAAEVRAAATLYHERRTRDALAALEALRPSDPEADAERLHFILLCWRRLDDADSMMAALEQVRRRAPSSEWTLKSLIQAANHFLVRNEPARYGPLFRACADLFPAAPEAAGCHWKTVWRAWIERRSDAGELLREHLLRFPASDRAGAALYYLGKIEEERGNFSAARAYFSELRARFPNYYYAALAAPKAQAATGGDGAAAGVRKFLDSVRWPPRPRSADFAADEEAQWRIGRARILAAEELGAWGEIELRFGVRNGASRYALALELATIASGRGAYGAAVRHIRGAVPDYLWLPREAAPRRFWELAFPFPYRSAIEHHARRNGLDPLLVAALIRQESEFDPEAVSSSGAIGLMQVMPATGRQLGRKLKLGAVTARSLHRPAINLAIGTYYLARLLEQHKGHVEAALAAYNAGPTRVPVWLGWGEFREPNEFVETIPFSQTRDYVQIILRNLEFYRWLYGAHAAATAEAPRPSPPETKSPKGSGPPPGSARPGQAPKRPRKTDASGRKGTTNRVPQR